MGPSPFSSLILRQLYVRGRAWNDENTCMIKKYGLFSLDSPILSLSLMVVLTTWTLYPPALIFPLPSLVALAYGLLTKRRVWAFLLGLIPYLPLVFLGGPKASLLLILGIPAGAMGFGSAMFRRDRPYFSRGVGILLILISTVWWLPLFARLSN